ncbi:MAG: right-handed parallel beta-helix repeat-containing protein [Bacteroidales bacterium]|nr:right-handed parallel beta-helix repeat-containing protein [Bacteroidales bacterium]HOI31161.1 right-handed parallel beta-helix repeat-containing protein [Bacteroidales bacterium]
MKKLMLIYGLLVIVWVCQAFSAYSQNCDQIISSSQTVVDGANIQPGDTICLESGNRTYLLFRNISGTENLPVVIVNQGNVIIDTDHFYGIKTSNCKHLKIIGSRPAEFTYGIKVQRVGNGAGITLDDLSTNIELSGIEVSHTALAGIYAKTDPDCSFEATREKFTFYNLEIHDCYLHHIGDEGFYIGSSKYTGQYLPDCDTTVLPHMMHNVLIYNNLIEDTGWDGLQVSSAVGDCRIFSNRIFRDSYKETYNQMSGILIGGGSECDCYNNQIFDGKGDGIDMFGHGDNKIYNNLIVRAGKSFKPENPDESRHGIFIGTAPDISSSNLSLLHNTIIDPKTTGIRYFNSNTAFNFIANNLITRPGAYDQLGNNAYFNHSLTTELYELTGNLFTQSIDLVDFVDFSEDNFDLKAESPAINIATDLGYSAILFDILGRPRPHNNGFDQGAFECQEINAHLTQRIYENKKPYSISYKPLEKIICIELRKITASLYFEIIDLNGQIVFRNREQNIDSKICHLQLSQLNDGIYILKIIGFEKVYTEKINLIR